MGSGTPHAGSRQRLRAEDRQAAIVKAAVDLAGAQGMDNVTTQAIAEVVGVTQGAIFRHFPSKDAIWIAVVHWACGRLMSAVDTAASQASDPLDALERIYFAHLSLADKNPLLPRLLLATAPRIKEVLREMLAGYEQKLVRLLREAKQQGRARSDLDPASAASLLLAVIQGLVTRILVLGARKSLATEARHTWPLYLAAIGARPRAS